MAETCKVQTGRQTGRSASLPGMANSLARNLDRACRLSILSEHDSDTPARSDRLRGNPAGWFIKHHFPFSYYRQSMRPGRHPSAWSALTLATGRRHSFGAFRSNSDHCTPSTRGSGSCALLLRVTLAATTSDDAGGAVVCRWPVAGGRPCMEETANGERLHVVSSALGSAGQAGSACA